MAASDRSRSALSLTAIASLVGLSFAGQHQWIEVRFRGPGSFFTIYRSRHPILALSGVCLAFVFLIACTMALHDRRGGRIRALTNGTLSVLVFGNVSASFWWPVDKNSVLHPHPAAKVGLAFASITALSLVVLAWLDLRTVAPDDAAASDSNGGNGIPSGRGAKLNT
jgi:hypothetical protein